MPLPNQSHASRASRDGRRVALLIASAWSVADLCWFLQALGSAPRHTGSNVARVSLAVWTVLHLPAALVAGLALDGGTGPGLLSPLPLGDAWLLGGLGLAQTFGLVFAFTVWKKSRP